MSTKVINEDLLRERSKATFNVNELTHLLDGSEEKTQRRKELEKDYYEDPELQDTVPVDYQTHSEVYASTLAKSLKIYDKAMDLADPQEILYIADGMVHEASPLTLHYVMFIPALMGHANEDQQTKWLVPALENKIVGTYAQTELGHGTNLRGLETRAIYDLNTQEFVLHSPTLSSVKWWPGGLGKTANHAIVLAQLFIKDKCYGLHPFMVQIRSMENHQPLPGVTVGEIGPKMGMRAADNGFLKLDHVRIPRDHMLMKNAKITPEGEYIRPKSDKLNYGTMVFVRVLLIDMVAFNVAKAVTIAIRYSAVRRQSELIPGQGEVQILDYQAQQYKLFPLIGFSHACKAAFVSIMNTYKNATEGLEKGDLATLPELHAISSGLKALCSDFGSQAIETCRRACGGHGYLLASGLPRLYAMTVAACTYEGENTVLFLQTARYILKCLRQEQPLVADSAFRYLLHPPQHWSQAPMLCPAVPSAIGTELSSLVQLFQCAAYHLIHSAVQNLQRLIDSGMAKEIAWNSCQIDLINAAKAHLQYYIALKYVEWLQNNSTLSPSLLTVLSRVCHVYLLFVIIDHSGPFLQAGLSHEELQKFGAAMPSLLLDLRPDAVALVDAFDFHDVVLNSALGCYDGQVYQRLYDLALKAPLNKTQVHESYHKHLHQYKSKL